MQITPQGCLSPIGRRALGWGALALVTLGGGEWVPPAIATPTPPTKAQGFNVLADIEYWAGLCRLQITAEAYDQALVACEQAIALAPADAHLWMLRSNVLLQLQNYPEAIASADRALFFDPQSSLAITYRCIGYAALNENEAALEACNHALEVDGDWGPTSPALAWLHQGIVLSQAGQLEQAALALERTLRLEPNYSLALAYQCRIQNDLELAQSAISSCEAALAGNGQWGNESAAMAWVEQGRAYSQLRDYGAAIAAYDQALNLDPNNAVTWTAQGQVLQQLQRPTEALTSLTRAAELEATYSLAQLGRCGALNRLNQHEAALETCNLALQGDGRWGDRGIVEAFNQRSVALTGLGHYDEALASISRAVGMAPDYAEAHHHQAVILWYLKRYDDALAANQRSLDLDSNHARTWLNRGVILRSMQRYEAALAAYDQGLRIAPYNDALWANRSVVMWHLQRYDEALASANQAIAFNPDSAQGWYNRAIALTAQKQWQNALDAYTQVLALTPPHAPQSATALTGQGVALINLGRYQAAIAILQAAIALNPDQPLAQQSLQTAQQYLQPPPP